MKLADVGPVHLVGAGKMGMALARGWLSGGLPADRLVLVDPQPHDSVRDFAQVHGVALRADLPVNPPRVLVLAVKPQIMGEVLASARRAVDARTLVLSIAAGISIDVLGSGLGTRRVIRTMPNTPAQVGKGVTGAVAGPGADAEDRAAAEALLAAVGTCVWLDREAAIDAVTAVSGSGPAYVFLLVEAMADAGVALGLGAEQAMLLARETVVGAAALMEADPSDAAVLRANVTSPGGTTAAALKVLMGQNGLTDLMKQATEAARRRSVELGG